MALPMSIDRADGCLVHLNDLALSVAQNQRWVWLSYEGVRTCLNGAFEHHRDIKGRSVLDIWHRHWEDPIIMQTCHDMLGANTDENTPSRVSHIFCPLIRSSCKHSILLPDKIHAPLLPFLHNIQVWFQTIAHRQHRWMGWVLWELVAYPLEWYCWNLTWEDTEAFVNFT